MLIICPFVLGLKYFCLVFSLYCDKIYCYFSSCGKVIFLSNFIAASEAGTLIVMWTNDMEKKVPMGNLTNIGKWERRNVTFINKWWKGFQKNTVNRKEHSTKTSNISSELCSFRRPLHIFIEVRLFLLWYCEWWYINVSTREFMDLIMLNYPDHYHRGNLSFKEKCIFQD